MGNQRRVAFTFELAANERRQLAFIFNYKHGRHKPSIRCHSKRYDTPGIGTPSSSAIEQDANAQRVEHTMNDEAGPERSAALLDQRASVGGVAEAT